MAVPERLDEIGKLLIDGTNADTVRWTLLRSGGFSTDVDDATFVVSVDEDGAPTDDFISGISLRVLNERGDEIDSASVKFPRPQTSHTFLSDLYIAITEQHDRFAKAKLAPITEKLRRQVLKQMAG